jgi:small subunit ribosomal protein S16
VRLTTFHHRGDTTTVAVKIRLKRLGKIRVPQYRIVVVDSRKKRDGKVIEEIGKYHPKEDPSYIDVVSERAQYWLKFKGLPGEEGTLKVKPAKRDKLEIFNEALKEADGDAAAATTKKASKKAEKTEEPKAEETPAEEPKAEETAEAPAAEAGDDKAEA